MSREAEMSFKFLIAAVGIKDELENYVNVMRNDIEMIFHKENPTKVYVSYIPYDLDKIKTYLKLLCDTNEVKVIIIIGEDKNKEYANDIVFEATRTVMNNFISKKMVPFISNLDKELINIKLDLRQKGINAGMFSVCGVQKNTLVFNTFGTCMMTTCMMGIFYQRNKETIIDLLKIMQSFASVNDQPSACNIPDLSLEKIKKIKKYRKIPTVTVEKAIYIIGIIASQNSIIESEPVEVFDAYGRILLEDIYSKCNVPSFKTSAKNGYAIIVNDGKNEKKILKTGTCSLKPGTCVKIQAEASIPDEATAVVEIKNIKTISKDDDNDSDIDMEENEEKIEIIIEPKEGKNIRPIGHKIKVGEKILNKHTRIGPAEIGLLTYSDIYCIRVIKHPSVGILSIGDELQELGEILREKHIYDSNRLILSTLLKQEGFNVLDFGITSDNITSISNKINEILEKVNVIVTIGSANDRDLLKPILQECFNATIHFGNVDMKPGKSTAYATCMFKSTMKHFLCLSKNPAVIPIAAHLFLLPLLNELRCFHKECPSMLARIQLAPDLHPRPKYIWTELKWKKDSYPWILNTTNNINNVTNALLRLPPRNMEMLQLLPDVFISTILIGLK